MDLKSIFLTIAITVLGGLFRSDAESIMLKLSLWIARKAAHRLAPSVRANYEAEWQQFIIEITGPFSRLVHSISLFICVRRVNSALGPPSRSGDGWLYPEIAKRLFDISFSAAFLILAGVWLLPLIACALRIAGQPIFQLREVKGLNGRHFWAISFFCGDIRPSGRAFSSVGRFLLRTGLGELPIFINVLKGDMSIVGPRPMTPEVYEAFADRAPFYLRMRPGVTGLSRIAGVREGERLVSFESFYFKNRSFLMDVKLVFLTVKRALLP